MKQCYRVLIVFLFSASCFCFGGVPAADFDGDCSIDHDDLVFFVLEWLNQGERISDLNNDELVNLADFALFVEDFDLAFSPLIISEFMANNKTTLSTLVQGAAVYADWIEIYNRSSQIVSLDGWYLTDNDDALTKWPFPSTLSIAPYSYLVVFASGKTQNEHPANYPFFDGVSYHTNFSLDNGGEYLALTGPNFHISQFSPEYPSQTSDIAYGLLPEAYDQPVFFTNATPGAQNIPGYVAPPVFSVSGGLYQSPFQLTLTGSPAARIYVALDGEKVSPTYSLYTSPILLSASRVIKAYAVEPGIGQSVTAAEYYVKLNASMAAVNSDLPIVILDSMRLNPNQDSYTTVTAALIEAGDSGRAAIGDDPQYFGRAAIKIRGASSAGFPKRQYAFEIRDDHGADKAVELLGMPEESDWILHAPYSDKTLMRNYLTYGLANEMGRYAARCRYVELYLNTGAAEVGSATYAGVYILMERIKGDPARVDIAKLEPYHNAEPEITGGYLICRDRPEAGEYSMSTTRGFKDLILQEPDSYEATPQQKNWIQQHLNAVENVLFSSTYTDPVVGYAADLDADSFIDTHLLVQACKNIDGIRLSGFFYKDRGGKIVIGPPWDYNLAHGNADYLDGWNPTGWYDVASAGASDSYIWFGRLFTDQNYRLRYADRWFQLRETVFRTDKVAAQVDQIAAMLNEAQQRNFTRWPVLGTYLWPNPAGYAQRTTYQAEVDWMKTWQAARYNWMDSQIAIEYAAAPPVFNQDGGYAASGFNVQIASPGGTLYYTTDGQDPRLHNGILNPSARVFGDDQYHSVAILPAGSVWKYLDNGSNQGTAWRTTTFNDQSWAFGPAQLGYGEGDEATVVSYGPDAANKYRTTYFRTAFTVDDVSKIAGVTVRLKRDDGAIVYLNSTPTNTNEIIRSNMNAGTVDYLTAASQAAPDDGQTFTDFTTIPVSYLKNGQNILAVEIHQNVGNSSDLSFDLELAVLMFAEGSELVLDKSTQVLARAKNGSAWTALNEATFAVGPVAESLRITELMYHPSLPDAEFIELRNIGAETLNLALVTFTRGIDFTFPSRELAPGQYVVVVENLPAFAAAYPDVVCVAGQYAGALDNSGETVELRDAAGTVIQTVEFNDKWYDIADGLGFSLVINDAYAADLDLWSRKSGWHPSAFLQGDPGADFSAEVPALGAVVIHEVLAHSDLQPSDWIELHNTTDAPISIGGWVLSDKNSDLDARSKYRIAAGTVIPANGYRVFYETQHFGNPADPGTLAAFALSENGEGLYLQSGSGGALTGYVAEEVFGPSLPDTSLGRYQKSTDTYNFVALAALTPGVQNSLPKVGPLVFTEVMYHPRTIGDAEYVEIQNISAAPVVLYDAVEKTPWRFVDDAAIPGVDFTFPSQPLVTVAPGEKILLLKNRIAFGMEFGPPPASVKVFEWKTGSLSNSSESLELQRPGEKDADGSRYWIRVERVVYDDKAPWPTPPDGQGQSLRRFTPADYGNDPANWQSAPPTPGL